MKPLMTDWRPDKNRQVNGVHAPFHSCRVQSKGVLQGETFRSHPVSKKPQYCFSYVEIWLCNLATKKKKTGRSAQVCRGNVLQYTNTHTVWGRYFLFVLFPSAAGACDSAEVNGGEETTRLPTSTQLQMCKQRTKKETRGVRGLGGGGTEGLWQAQSMSGDYRTPQWAGGQQRSRKSKGRKSRRQDWNSLTLFGGLCLNALWLLSFPPPKWEGICANANTHTRVHAYMPGFESGLVNMVPAAGCGGAVWVKYQSKHAFQNCRKLCCYWKYPEQTHAHTHSHW